jgi:hypothetical protein
LSRPTKDKKLLPKTYNLFLPYTNMPKRKKDPTLKYIGLGLLFLAKTPYYLSRGLYSISKKTSENIKQRKIKKNRESLKPKFEEFKIIKVLEGDYDNWINSIFNSDSKIGIILGARGSGKTAFGVRFLENYYSKNQRKCFAIGFAESEMPSWITVVTDISDLDNDSIVLIDEGGVLFNSRNAMSNANKMLSQLLMIARHKNLHILFISQNSSNLEVNILRQADFLVLKKSSLLQKEFERKIIQNIYKDIKKQFAEYQDDKGITHIYSDRFRGFVSVPLPSFWKESISKSFK